MKSALVFGASGLVGGHLTRQLLDDPRYGSVKLLVRKMLPLEHPKLEQQLFDFEAPDYYLVCADDLFCALGTTLGKAGTKPDHYRVDFTYPYELGKIAKQRGVSQYILVSSIMANSESWHYYLYSKGELENQLIGMNFDCFISVRPSLLLGKRPEFRFGEWVAQGLDRVFGRYLLKGRWRKFRAIPAEQVARAMIELANRGLTGAHIFESDELQTIGRENL